MRIEVGFCFVLAIDGEFYGHFIGSVLPKEGKEAEKTKRNVEKRKEEKDAEKTKRNLEKKEKDAEKTKRNLLKKERRKM